MKVKTRFNWKLRFKRQGRRQDADDFSNKNHHLHANLDANLCLSIDNPLFRNIHCDLQPANQHQAATYSLKWRTRTATSSATRSSAFGGVRHRTRSFFVLVRCNTTSWSELVLTEIDDICGNRSFPIETKLCEKQSWICKIWVFRLTLITFGFYLWAAVGGCQLRFPWKVRGVARNKPLTFCWPVYLLLLEIYVERLLNAKSHAFHGNRTLKIITHNIRHHATYGFHGHALGHRPELLDGIQLEDVVVADQHSSIGAFEGLVDLHGLAGIENFALALEAISNLHVVERFAVVWTLQGESCKKLRNFDAVPSPPPTPPSEKKKLIVIYYSDSPS